MNIIRSTAAAAAILCATTGATVAGQGAVPQGIPHLDHVWVVMMENHGYPQVMGNPNAPYINQLAGTANLATNYFGVAHPSLTNYLEVVGGSNFGVLDDNSPDWHNAGCQPNIQSGVANTEQVATPICPIWGQGADAPTPAIDYYNEVQGTPGNPATGDWALDGKKSFKSSFTLGMTIADQLDAMHMPWRSYQESLPMVGADGVDASDGVFVNTNDTQVLSNPTPPASQVVALYASKHNPFVYFKSVQEGGLQNVRAFDGDNGLFADLRMGKVPAFSFIAPNQCNDMHGKTGENVYCNYDTNNNGTQNGLNPGLIYRGNTMVKKLMTAIQSSPAWMKGNNAIVVTWDENDYSVGIPNQVVTMVVTNYGKGRVVSDHFYSHFSLLKTLEGGLGLPCLNNACDPTVNVMADMFRGGGN